jgi:hypothetical protein
VSTGAIVGHAIWMRTMENATVKGFSVSLASSTTAAKIVTFTDGQLDGIITNSTIITNGVTSAKSVQVDITEIPILVETAHPPSRRHETALANTGCDVVVAE